jgi:hypothetical protein
MIDCIWQQLEMCCGRECKCEDYNSDEELLKQLKARRLKGIVERADAILKKRGVIEWIIH